jgi:hypothetical protein
MLSGISSKAHGYWLGEQPLVGPAAKRGAMSAKCFAMSRSTQSKILQANCSLL